VVDGAGQGEQLGDLGVDVPGQEPVQPMAGQVRIAADPHRGQQGAQFLFRDPRRQDLGAGVLVLDSVPHLDESVGRQAFPRAQQPTPVGPLRVDPPAATIPQFPGDATAHLGDRVVG
jgi:hypothetical protein